MTFLVGAPVALGDEVESTTFYDYHAERLAFNRRTMVEDYQRVGTRDPKWDAQAVEFLDLVARRFTDASVTELYRDPTTPTVDAGIRLGTQVVDELGCTDPLVRYCLDRLLEDKTPGTLEPQHVVDTANALLESNYTAFRKLNALERARVVWADPDGPLFDPA
ncbi:MAG: hypothetical protein AAF656_13435, partial [Planctomycetota bacterium]